MTTYDDDNSHNDNDINNDNNDNDDDFCDAIASSCVGSPYATMTDIFCMFVVIGADTMIPCRFLL